MPLDQALRQYATDRQWEIMKAVEKHGSKKAAGRDLGIDPVTIREAIDAVTVKAARQGYAPKHDMTRTVPDGFHLKGTSTLYNADGEQKAQWVKSAIDHERQEQLLRAALQGLIDEIPQAAPVRPPEQVLSDLLAAFPVGDHHMGMLSWAPETGADYDLTIGRNLLCGAVEYLANSVPQAHRAVLPLLGDFVHYDSFVAQTPKSKNPLDSDSRFPKVVRATISVIRFTIATLLRRHAEVLVIVEEGNHDPVVTLLLREWLATLYENEPRVTVDVSPANRHYFDFGKNLVGITHGDKAKLDKLPLIMATDRPEEWGRTEYRYWWTGHVHHDQAKDIQGCKVESFRILPPQDAWAAKEGHQSMRDMKAIILHREHGEVARHTVNPGMLA